MSGHEHILGRITDWLGDLLPLARLDRQKAADRGWQEKITAEIELSRCLAVREDSR